LQLLRGEVSELVSDCTCNHSLAHSLLLLKAAIRLALKKIVGTNQNVLK
jgi:hypothetical protein